MELLSCVCAVFEPANKKCTSDKRTRGHTTAKRHNFEKHAQQDHQPREKGNVEFLMVLWRSTVAVECTVLSRYTGQAIAAHCQS